MDRPSEIPLRYVRRWMDLCDRFGALPLEEYVALAASLSDRQIRALDTLWSNPCLPPPLSDDLKVVDAAHNLLRLYGALTPGQRSALQRGAALPVAQLAARHWPLIEAELDRIARWQYPLQSRDQWLAGSFSLPAEPAVRVREERDGVASYRTDVVAGGAAPSVSATPSPAGSGSVRRYLVMQVRLRIEHGGGRGPLLTVARLPSR
jgi:hypothetical protein